MAGKKINSERIANGNRLIDVKSISNTLLIMPSSTFSYVNNELNKLKRGEKNSLFGKD